MKRYLLFAGWDQYPEGGWKDLIAEADTFSELLNRLTVIRKERTYYKMSGDLPKEFVGRNFTWWHIVDLDNREIIFDSRENLVLQNLEIIE